VSKSKPPPEGLSLRRGLLLEETREWWHEVMLG
jgi:hypothetical protein